MTTKSVAEERVSAPAVTRNMKRLITAVRPAWWGVLFIGLITIVFTTSASESSVDTYVLFLFACMGAISLQVLQGTAGLVSLGNPAFMLIGAFGTAFMVRQGTPFPLDVIAGTAMAGVAGLISGIPALRLRALFLALSTLAVFFVATFFAQLYLAGFPVASQSGFFLKIVFSSHGLLGEDRRWAWLLFGVVSLVILGASRIMGDRSGRALRFMRDHEHLAPTIGISTPSYKLILFTVTSAVIGLQGALMAHFIGLVSTDNFTITLAFQYVAMIVIGGLDSIAGAVIGAAIVTGLPVWVPTLITPLVGSTNATTYGPNAALVVYGALIVLFVTASPGGIVGLGRLLRRRLEHRGGRRDAKAVAASDANTS
jgi:branched-chain amino acid transport system permease protein